MLVLSRQQGQVIYIGDDITICVTQIDGNTVKIGIDAPKNVRIDRKEVRAARETVRKNVTLLSDRASYFQGVVDRSKGQTCLPHDPKPYRLAFEEYQNG